MWLVAGLATVALGFPAAAQQVVGTSLVDGRPVQLMSDFSWKYVSQTGTSCQSVQDQVSFCGQDAGWRRTSSGSGDAAAMYRLNDRTYGLFIVEGLGLEDGISAKMMRSAILENAAKLSGGEGKDVPVLGIEPAKVDGLPSETVIYVANSDGMSFVFLNTIAMDKKSTVQAVTYHVGNNVTDEMRALHKRFLDATRLK